MTNTAENIDVQENYYVDGMPNEEYHMPENGVSTSTLKLFMEDPSLVVWNRNAPRDQGKMKAIDFGTDFHTYFLEPERFEEEYQVLPYFNRRKKEEKQAELDLIAEWKEKEITPITAEDMAKLKSMRLSAMAHPTVQEVMTLGGVAERSYFWIDESTGLLCKCRPDLIIENIADQNRPIFMPANTDTLVVDIKTISDTDLIQKQIEKLKYFVQAPLYSAGVNAVTGGSVCFLFIFVSTSLSIGRYPVKPVTLSDVATFDGETMMREALDGYAQMSKGPESNWNTAMVIDRPAWATTTEEFSL